MIWKSMFALCVVVSGWMGIKALKGNQKFLPALIVDMIGNQLKPHQIPQTDRK